MATLAWKDKHRVDPDCYLASQGFDIPEKVLLIAILNRAIADYLSQAPVNLGSKKANTIYTDYYKRESETWLFAKNRRDNEREFGFSWICAHLWPDEPGAAEKLRRTLLRTKGDGRRARRAWARIMRVQNESKVLKFG